MTTPVADLSDHDLIDRIRGLVRRSNEITAELLRYLGEVDERKLYAADACSSLFAWCVTILGLSEDATYKRIAAARAARRFPVLLEPLAAGRLHLTGICLLAPHLDDDNHLELIAAASGLKRSQIEQLLADRWPKPDAPARIRRLPAPNNGGKVPDNGENDGRSTGMTDTRPGARPTLFAGKEEIADRQVQNSPPPRPTGDELAPGRVADSQAETRPTPDVSHESRESSRRIANPRPDAHTTPPPPVPPPVPPPRARGRIEPLGSERYKVQFTADKAWVEKLREATSLLSHRLPGGDMTEVLSQALTVLCETLMKERFSVPPKPGRMATARREKPATAEAVSPEVVSHETVFPVEAKAVSAEVASHETASHEVVEAKAVSPKAVDLKVTPQEAAESERKNEAPTPENGPDVSTAAGASIAHADEDSFGERGGVPPEYTGGGSRYIPASVRRQVVERDGLRCSFVDTHGRRCEETRFLELHHCRPWAMGGPNTADNLTFRCSCHNNHAAELDFGPRMSSAGHEPLSCNSTQKVPTG